MTFGDIWRHLATFGDIGLKIISERRSGASGGVNPLRDKGGAPGLGKIIS